MRWSGDRVSQRCLQAVRNGGGQGALKRSLCGKGALKRRLRGKAALKRRLRGKAALKRSLWGKEARSAGYAGRTVSGGRGEPIFCTTWLSEWAQL